MTVRQQKYLAFGGALAFVLIVLAANAQLLIAAFGSQPACVLDAAAGAPARRAC